MKPGHETPVNATASRVMARGDHFEYSNLESSSDSPLPMPIKTLTDLELKNPSFENLTGMKLGRLTVIGQSSEKRGRWVCRCACGMYVLRKASGIKNGNCATSPCDQCYLLAVSKKRDVLRRSGKQKSTEDFL